MKTILVGIDFSDLAEPLVQCAARVAAAFGASLRLVHVAAPDPNIAHSSVWPQEVRDELARELHEEHRQLEKFAETVEQVGVEAKAILARGEAAETLLDLAVQLDADLIVLGSHDRGKLQSLLPGSLVRQVVRTAPCGVMVLPESALGSREAGACGAPAPDAP